MYTLHPNGTIINKLNANEFMDNESEQPVIDPPSILDVG